MKRKGEGLVWATVITVIIVAVFAMLIIRVNKGSTDDVSKYVRDKMNEVTRDTDGDLVLDFRDPSPCLANRDKFTATDNKIYYDYGYGGENGEYCKLEGGVYKNFPDLDPSIILDIKTDMATGQVRCVYPAKVCLAELKEAYGEG